MTTELSKPRFRPNGRSIVFAMALVAAVPAPATSASPSSPAPSKNEAIVRQAFDKWAAGSGNVFDDLLAPDVVWTIHGSGPVAGTYRSRHDFVEKASRPLVSRLSTPIVPRVHHVWASDDTVVVRFDGQATTTSGTPYQNQFVWIFRMRDQVVVEAEAFLDLAAYQQVVDNNEPRRP